jgi:hypothetical protein
MDQMDQMDQIAQKDIDTIIEKKIDKRMAIV